jgi:hydroxymethylpyrimidine pyrophosphatase-like HAD family hydrolase
MVHEPVPDNHRFVFHEGQPESTDFRRRCELYAPYCRAWAGDERFGEGASQFVVIMPPDLARFERLAQAAAGLSVVRTTSPLDGVSLWMELFAAGTNKSGAAAWLSGRLGIAARDTYAVGNDFNDLDLLAWAAQARVTANAPAELASRFGVVPSHDEGGFAYAVRGWGLVAGAEQR